MGHDVKLFGQSIKNIRFLNVEGVDVLDRRMYRYAGVAQNGKPCFFFFIPHLKTEIPLVCFENANAVGEIIVYSESFESGTLVSANCSAEPRVIAAKIKKFESQKPKYGIQLRNENGEYFYFPSRFPVLGGVYPMVEGVHIPFNPSEYFVSVKGIMFYSIYSPIPGDDHGDPDIDHWEEHYRGFSILPTGLVFKGVSEFVPLPQFRGRDRELMLRKVGQRISSPFNHVFTVKR